MRRLQLALLCLAIGCASPTTYWVKSGPWTTDDWHREYGQCRAQSHSIMAGCATMFCMAQASNAENACLEGFGWYKQ